ncbi:PadR family transcriptional regulator [Parasphingopyxis marina]|uniref:Helix-turn-helix transcriptional regulator n=1 Tax=Parasphingopyxis marina TaxID=2761622 RepID=A0A842HSX3_9SPHN|nr:helix-turn-helix transcriptional regulator [Parasphingopyxis marina]MBC2776045.1 helix-turn-helix transcriptional regulator [Parasphingopyxis marina]
MAKKATPKSLSDHEGSLLSLVYRFQPITAYKVAKYYQSSPVASFNKSMGQVYPMIARFAKEGLIESKRIEGDARGTELWSITRKGEGALKTWVQTFRSAQLVASDSLSTKVMAFGLLQPQERIDWVIEAKAELEKKRAELDAFNAQTDLPFQAFAYDNAASTLKARMDWLDRVHLELVTNKDKY